MRCRRAIFGVSTKLSPQNNRDGFTLIELIVVITLFGVISAAAIVNWSSFMQYQEMRKAAQNLHKELLALRASALSDSVEYEVDYSSESYYTILKEGVAVRTVTLPNNVIVQGFSTESAGGGDTEAEGYCSCSEWPDKKITIRPDRFDPFVGTGRMAVTRSGAAGKRMFCIAKDDKQINPRIFFRSSGAGSWKKI